MAEHPNVELMRRGYGAFAAGDMQTLDELFADDIVWHSPGNGPLAGDRTGKEAVFGLFAKLAELTEGTFRQDIHDIVANDQHVCVLIESGWDKPHPFEGRGVQMWHVSEGKAREFWFFGEDQAAADAAITP